MSPLLSQFYIGNLADNPTNEAVIVMFTDDVSIFTAAKNKADKTYAQSAAKTEVGYSYRVCHGSYN